MITSFKITSGGQTGIDELGLQLAKAYNISTGGWMPPNYLTEEGTSPVYKQLYNMQEMSSGLWSKRMRQNVIDTDATIVFGNVESGGTKATINFCIKNSKPYLINPSGEELLVFVIEYDISILNIAENRASVLSPEDKIAAAKSLRHLFAAISKLQIWT